MLPLSLHVRMVRLSFFNGFLRAINLRSCLTILSNLNSVGGTLRIHTLFVKRRARSSRCCGLSLKIKVTAEILDLFFFLSRRAMVILKVWYVCQIICIAGDVQRQNKLWARHLIASGSFIRMSVVNDTLPPDFSVKFLWLGWKSPDFFPENY